MSSPSIPDRAAAAVNAIEKARDRIGDLRRAGGEWTDLSMMLNEIEGIAHAGLMTAYTMAQRVHAAADTAARRQENEKP